MIYTNFMNMKNNTIYCMLFMSMHIVLLKHAFESRTSNSGEWLSLLGQGIGTEEVHKRL